MRDENRNNPQIAPFKPRRHRQTPMTFSVIAANENYNVPVPPSEHQTWPEA